MLLLFLKKEILLLNKCCTQKEMKSIFDRCCIFQEKIVIAQEF
jgi:hypothetical protein